MTTLMSGYFKGGEETLLTTDDIMNLILDDRMSKRKRLARVARRYYEGRHDILDKRVFYVNKDGKLVEDPFKSNIRISHPFFRELVTQLAQYMVSGGIHITSKEPELQEELDYYFDECFEQEVKELVAGAAIDGCSYLYAYQDEDGRTRFCQADGIGVIEIPADGYCPVEEDTVIHYYPIRVGLHKVATRVEVWTRAMTYYYLYGAGQGIHLDTSVPINPRPHVLYEVQGDWYYEGLGYLPFFRLDNNAMQHSDLRLTKAIIDDYDIMDCSLSNNLEDIAEGIYVVKGYKGANIDELMLNLKSKKGIGVSEKGGVDIQTVSIPYEARKVKMETDRENIYHFGMGFDPSQTGDGNVTNIVLKGRYTLLDLRANEMAGRLKALLRRVLDVVLDEINDRLDSAYTSADVEIEIERIIPTNDIDNATIAKTEAETQQIRVNTILAAASALPDPETIAQRLCQELGVEYDEIKDRLDLTTTSAGLNEASEALLQIQKE